jgi:hypothetical protein
MLLGGCGGGSGPASNSNSNSSTGASNNAQSLFPLTKGYTWTYQDSVNQGSGQTITWTALGQQTFNGKAVWALQESPPQTVNGVTLYDVRYIQFTTSGAVFVGSMAPDAYGDQQTETVSPAQITIPATTTAGYKWTEQYVSTSTGTNPQYDDFTDTSSDSGTVVGVETVTVPAGTFNNAVHISVATTDVTNGGTTTTDYWRVPNIGLVKVVIGGGASVSGGSTSVLTAYTQ